MKDDIMKILYMGLGAMSLTSEKALELKKDLEQRGQTLFEKGKVVNEELKHDISEKIKENVTVTIEKKDFTVEDMLNKLDKLSDEEKAKLLEKLNSNKEKGNDEKGKK